MAAPTLAVPRIGEQLLDELLIPVGRRIGLERGEVLRLRRQADEIERDPANEDVPRRLGLRHDARLLVGLGEKGVDRVSHPRRVLHGGHFRSHPRLKRPMALWIGLGLLIRRRGAAGLDPVPDHRELLGRQRLSLALGRHPRGRIGVAHPLEDQAGVGIPLRDHPARLAPFEHQGDRVEPQASLLLETAVTGKTPFGQERPDFFGING